MKELSSWWRVLKVLLLDQPNSDPVLDHVPINGEYNFDEKLARARARHGREFHTHERKPRETPYSPALLAIREAQTRVTTKQNTPAPDTQQKVRAIKVSV